MAGPADFALVEVTAVDVVRAKLAYARMGARALAGEHGWAGFAAEFAFIHAVAEPITAEKSPTLDYDVRLRRLGGKAEPRPIALELKTRVAEEGWTHPEKFEWLVVPTHEGREPIKPAADLVVFCWYALEQRDRLWVLGQVRGADEFRRRAVFYREGEPLPRGGWAGPGGAYAINVKELRPMPRSMFKELDR